MFSLYVSLRSASVNLLVVGAGASVLAAEPTPELKQKFEETIAASTFPIAVKNGRVIGVGADSLKSKAAASPFFLIGDRACAVGAFERKRTGLDLGF